MYRSNNDNLVYIKLQKPNNQDWSITKQYDPLLLQSLASFRGLIIGEFYREIVNSNDMTLAVKIKNQDSTLQSINDELDWSQFVSSTVKSGYPLQFLVKCKAAKKVYKKQVKQIDQRLREIEFEAQILHLKKQIAENNLSKIMEQKQDTEENRRETLLESIRKGKDLNHTPKVVEKPEPIDPRERLLNAIKLLNL